MFPATTSPSTAGIDASKFKTIPFKHQLEGIDFLVNHKRAALFDEQGLGKTKQLIDTACLAYEAGEIDTCCIVCPSSVKLVWLRLDFGEIKLHSWVPGYISHYWSYNTQLLPAEKCTGKFYWIVTSYEFLRSQGRVLPLMRYLATRKAMFIADESSFIKNSMAKQTKAAINVARVCSRRYIANGTPLTHSPVDLFSQMWLLDPKILNAQNVFQFRNRHLVMGGWNKKQIMAVKNMDLLQRQCAPYVIRREKKDCLDLPEKLPSVVAGVTLTDQTWKHYVEMRDYMITFLDEEGEERSMTRHAVVKIMRLAQLCQGILGGVEPELLDSEGNVKVLSYEKSEWAKAYVQQKLEEDPEYRGLFWCHFRKQGDLMESYLSQYIEVVRIKGGMGQAAKEEAVRKFSTGTTPMVCIGQPQAGGFGLNLQHRCHDVVYLSCDYNLGTRLQSEDRVHRSGQRFAVSYTDCLAVGPRGQKTIEHTMDAARRNKRDLADLTTSGWKSMLRKEAEELVF